VLCIALSFVIVVLDNSVGLSDAACSGASDFDTAFLS